MSGLFAPHDSTVLLHLYIHMQTLLSVFINTIFFQCVTEFVSDNVDMYRLYHTLLCSNFLPKLCIPRLSGQYFLHIPYIIGIYS
jgi:hypothetical protein